MLRKPLPFFRFLPVYPAIFPWTRILISRNSHGIKKPLSPRRRACGWISSFRNPGKWMIGSSVLPAPRISVFIRFVACFPYMGLQPPITGGITKSWPKRHQICDWVCPLSGDRRPLSLWNKPNMGPVTGSVKRHMVKFIKKATSVHRKSIFQISSASLSVLNRSLHFRQSVVK